MCVYVYIHMYIYLRNIQYLYQLHFRKGRSQKGQSQSPSYMTSSYVLYISIASAHIVMSLATVHHLETLWPIT